MRSCYNSSFKLVLCVFMALISLSCKDSGEGGPSEVTPTNLTLAITIVGSDAQNPNGDGSGLVRCVATANDAVRYEFDFGPEDKVDSSTGMAEHTYKLEGDNLYRIRVTAYSDTDNAISTSENVTVYVSPVSFTDLVWSDEFEGDGAVDNTKWIHETQGPNGGRWWNGEEQHYTDRIENSFVSDGTLKIMARKEQFSSSGITLSYTSARLNSRFSFTYGRVDVRAKLPAGEGTWPAIWTLGSNITTVGWPACGEIDIMEHWGHNPTKVSSAIHTVACSGANNCDAAVGETTVSDFDTEFHVYSTVWTENEIRFYIDDEFRYRYKPATKTTENWPFTADQFILLNVAMGGDWFNIDPEFEQSSMEVDYVRVYQ